VPAWSIAEPQALDMRLTVNGEEMQKDSTRNMIWTLREQIDYLSTVVTLEPGDVIATGTPTGVGMGRGIYLKPGDVVSASIDGIGTLINTVVAEKI
jgi:2-keto-4-pentenoate hydratase/2-oxohepta-3-ene-1,7-dioic acid hydratase in catechol pathway